MLISVHHCSGHTCGILRPAALKKCYAACIKLNTRHTDTHTEWFSFECTCTLEAEPFSDTHIYARAQSVLNVTCRSVDQFCLMHGIHNVYLMENSDPPDRYSDHLANRCMSCTELFTSRDMDCGAGACGAIHEIDVAHSSTGQRRVYKIGEIGGHVSNGDLFLSNRLLMW